MKNKNIAYYLLILIAIFAIPFGNGNEKSPSYLLQRLLHKPVAYVILPIFAIANTAITIGGNWQEALTQASSLGIFAGLVVGKPLGIFIFSFIGVALGLCKLPSGLRWRNVIGAGFLGGIGFTMSIFITLLAFDDDAIINNSKFAIIVSSVIAGIIGFTILKLTLKSPVIDDIIED